MGYASRAGRARVNSSNPEAFGVCDRCGRWYNRVDLKNQYDWRGASLMPTYAYVCWECYDVPQQQLRAITLSPDPVPIAQPRVEQFLADESGYLTGPIGAPVGLDINAVMPLFQKSPYAVPINLMSVTASGTTSIAVTTSTQHGLSTGDQIAVQGLSNSLACGFFSVTVRTLRLFDYTTAEAVPAGGLLTPTTLMITAAVGLPLGVTTIPQVG